MRFVVTGTGRSGTRWASKVLGVGHQAMFTGDGFVDTGAAGDSSFWAASENLEGWRVVLLVRDPRLVVASWLESGEFDRMLERGYMRLWQHCVRIEPEVVAVTGQHRLELYWHAVNFHLAQQADAILRIEDTTPEALAAACQVDEWSDVPPPSSQTQPVEFLEFTGLERDLGYAR